MFKIRKYIFIILMMLALFVGYFLAVKPQATLLGAYQSDRAINGYHIQLSVDQKKNEFSLFIDNREVESGIYKQGENNTYELLGEKRTFLITLDRRNTFELVINKLNDGNPIQMINISHTPMGFGTEFTDIDVYKDLLD